VSFFDMVVLGVGVVWFLANKLRMSVEPKIEIKAISSD